MGKILIPTSFNIDLEFEPPEFHIRMFAWMIDFFLQLIYLIIVFNVFGEMISKAGLAGTASGYDLWAIELVILLPVFCYHLVCETFWNGQSIGKKLLHIRVVHENGGRASLSQYILRWLLRASDLTIPIIVISIGFGMVGFLKGLYATTILLVTDIVLIITTRRCKRVGDVAAGTMIIKTRQRGSLDDTIFVEVANDYTPVFPQVMRLSDRDINTVKGILDMARKKGYTEMVERASERVMKVLGIETEMHPFDFLDTLLKDYNYLSTK
jgi:uncharacterized RDD family membrane protein YckC